MATVAERKKQLKPGKARLLAVVFLLGGIFLGALDAPGYFASLSQRSEFLHSKFLLLDSYVPYRFGLDIRGGTHLVYEADTSGIAEYERSDSLDAVRDVIERRVNLFGVAEPLVQVERSGEDWRLIVELAGIQDVNAAIRLIGATPFLEFKEERSPEEREKLLAEIEAGTASSSTDPYFISSGLTGRHLKKAYVDLGGGFGPQIALELTDEGAELFEEVTARNIGKQLAIYLDGAPLSAPVVQDKISGGRAQITGDFTLEEVKELVGRMNAGALPVPITLIAQQSIGASLGQESLEKSLRAGMFGLIAVALFMIFWYRLPGVLAALALLFYIVAVLAIFKLIPVTLTVAGIAGFILSVGMAVDANILIFERLKEELIEGKSFDDAIREGFGRAWTSIRDSNISSLITAAILYWAGTSLVQGFALTLSIGILVSMFSAISVTRTLLIAVMTRRAEKSRWLFISGF